MLLSSYAFYYLRLRLLLHHTNRSPFSSADQVYRRAPLREHATKTDIYVASVRNMHSLHKRIKALLFEDKYVLRTFSHFLSCLLMTYGSSLSISCSLLSLSSFPPFLCSPSRLLSHHPLLTLQRASRHITRSGSVVHYLCSRASCASVRTIQSLDRL